MTGFPMGTTSKCHGPEFKKNGNTTKSGNGTSDEGMSGGNGTGGNSTGNHHRIFGGGPFVPLIVAIGVIIFGFTAFAFA